MLKKICVEWLLDSLNIPSSSVVIYAHTASLKCLAVSQKKMNTTREEEKGPKVVYGVLRITEGWSKRD